MPPGRRVRYIARHGSVSVMGETPGEPLPDLNANEIDDFVSAVNAVLGSVPGIGPLMAELVTSVIPRQRLDRVAEMVRILDERLGDFQENFVRERMLRPGSADLVQAALPQAGTSTEERLPYITALLKNGITSDELLYEQEKEILFLLGQLNDSELIILGWHGTDMVGPEAEEYRQRHEDVLQDPIEETGRSDEQMSQDALKLHYRANLERLGLLMMNARGRRVIAPLGRLLLKRIDFYSLQGLEEQEE
jgi:hypothetical protein